MELMGSPVAALATSWVGLARIQEERGDFERSCQSARSALTIRPKLAEAYWRLAFILRGRLPDAEVQAMEDLLDDRYRVGAGVDQVAEEEVTGHHALHESGYGHGV